MIRIAVIACNETEDIELLVPVDLWRRVGIRVDTISLEKKNSIILNSGVKISCDNIIEKTNFEQYNAIYLPGGSGYKKYFIENWPPRNNEGVVKLHKHLNKFNEENKDIYALCAAPNLLGSMGILNNKKATCYPSFEEPFKKNYVNEPVVIDKNIVTGRSPAAIFDFSFIIVERLLNKKALNDLKKEIIYYQDK